MRKEKRMISMLRGGVQKEYEVLLDPVPHVILDQSIPIRGWYKSKWEAKNKRPRPCYSEAVLTTPFGGYCFVGCPVCYVNLGGRGYRASKISTVDPEYPEKTLKRLDSLYTAPQFYISSFTEPFQQLESEYHVVQRLTEGLLERNVPFFYLTRLIPPDWALDALTQIPNCYLQMSINTSIEKDWRKLSPGAPKLEEMYELIAKAKQMGIYVSIQCNPILLGISTMQHMTQLIHNLSVAGVDHIIFKFIEIVYNRANVLVSVLERMFPGRVGDFERVFTQHIGGHRVIAQSIRSAALDIFSKHVYRSKMTMSVCYEFQDGLPRFGYGSCASMSPDYTTSEQCHGKASPIYFRRDLNEKFQPFKKCPGVCLYCEERYGNPCGNDILKQAKAMKFSDWKKVRL